MRLSFGWKLGISISLMALTTTMASVLWMYSQTRDMVVEQMGNRLKDIGRAGAFLLGPADRQTIQELTAIVQGAFIPPPDMTAMKLKDMRAGIPPDLAERLMQEARFQSLVQALRKIREGTRDEVRPLRLSPSFAEIEANEADLPSLQYTYLLIPLPGDTKYEYLIYLADGDYAPVDHTGDGDFDDEDDFAGNAIGTVTRAFPDMREAFRTGRAMGERDFSEDAWGYWLSGYVPIKNARGETIAVLGMDYNVSSAANKIAALRTFAISAIAGVFLLSLFVAFVMARALTRPIKTLQAGAERVADRDFSTQVEVESKDELGVLADSFNMMVTEIRDYAQNLEALNVAYERFVPQEFLQNMGQANIVNVKLGDQVQREMTVLFSDIRSFTTMSETMTPKENFDFLNGYLGRVSPLIRSHHGFIDKFIGDAIMALFPRGVHDAVENSIDMLNTVTDYNTHRERLGYPAIRIGIGLHTGNLMLGTIGEERRMEGTVISDAVNLASRLESLTKRFGANILISEYSLQRMENRGAFHVRCLGRVRVKGKLEPVQVYEIFSGESERIVELKLETGARFAEGLELFQRGKFGDAHIIFEEILRINPQDAAAAAYSQKLESMARR